MAVGFPYNTGDVLTAADMNGLVAFSINAQTNTTYTATSTDTYQVLVTMNNAAANAFKIPTNASVAFPIGTVLSVLCLSGTTTISAVTSGTTTVLSAGATAAAPTVAQYKSAACIKTGTDTWYVVGAIA
jgi:hypothetical protein